MDAAIGFPLIVALVGIALLFDFLNGLHDAANSIATIVSTRVLRPHFAVAWAAFFNFIAFLFFGLHVAQTIGTGIVSAIFVWLGFMLTSMAVNNAFTGRKIMLTLIDAGHWLGVMLILGAVLGAFAI